MRDPARIPIILKELERVWLQNPDLRLTQLIMGIAQTQVTAPELFYMEDEKFMEKLKEFEKE